VNLFAGTRMSAFGPCWSGRVGTGHPGGVARASAGRAGGAAPGFTW